MPKRKAVSDISKDVTETKKTVTKLKSETKAISKPQKKGAVKKSKETPVSNKASAKVKTNAAKSSALNLLSYLSDEGWLSELETEFKKDYFKLIENMLDKDYRAGLQIFPPKDLIFNAFNKTPLDKVKVVILGQDPYHDDGQAMGMSFSVPEGLRLPPSLKNIYKELVNDKDIKNFSDIPSSGCLEKWGDRGVLLINATLTVEAHKANSHKNYGWQSFTDSVIKTISDKKQDVVFLLWGGFAHKKEKLIDASKHSVIKTAHPSPLSFSKFLGCKCFSLVNNQLKMKGKPEIDWSI